MVILNSYAYQIVCVPNIEKWNSFTSGKGAANVACFDGIAFYKSDGRYFVATYPTFISLTHHEINRILIDNGYIPSNGYYAPIFNSFGIVREISKDDFYKAIKDYPVRMDDYSLLGW